MSFSYLKNIIFSKSNLSGCYRYNDLFQIYPINITNAPQSENVNNKPCCFEFLFDALTKVPNLISIIQEDIV